MREGTEFLQTTRIGVVRELPAQKEPLGMGQIMLFVVVSLIIISLAKY